MGIDYIPGSATYSSGVERVRAKLAAGEDIVASFSRRSSSVDSTSISFVFP